MVTFIRWLHRAYRNIDAISPSHRRFDTGWAIGAWFVPFLNLWRPKQTVNDVWNSGSQAGRRPAFWLMLWWIGWLAGNVLGRIAFPDLGENPTLPQLRQDSVNSMISDGFAVAVIALAILTIRVVAKRQETRAEEGAALPRHPVPGTPDSTPPPAVPAASQPA